MAGPNRPVEGPAHTPRTKARYLVTPDQCRYVNIIANGALTAPHLRHSTFL